MFSFTGIMNLTTLIDQAQEYLNSSKCEDLVVSLSYHLSSFQLLFSKPNKIQILKIIFLWVWVSNLAKLVLIERKHLIFRMEQKKSDQTWHSAPNPQDIS